MALSRAALWLSLIIPSALLGGALISEYVFGLYPCEMCMWQRWPHLAAIIFALGAIAVRGRKLSKFIVADAALAILISGLIGGFHAGVEYGWWEGITSCATNVPAGGDMLDSIMNAPLVRCDVAPWSLFGISLAGYNFLLSVGGAILILVLLAKGRKDHA
ncbi:disulfide bond formation protein B [Parasphingorhabdus cellanae]|uniref:Disulfide bond formation protein B n=1 Tax=Parasphingorhabdus cellanae TaxID=2806553 RepID=A0ABX7SZD8_9SPHN|nr:disulfide bond formation protein B [Parasphingorhabdus cellanae]QTD54634.1 disulfide bond formation protein B [Parasphingorhabdus cellanae]